MALRAVWKGFLKFGGVSCGIKLINAASESEKIHFRILNRKDRLPVKAAYVDEIKSAFEPNLEPGMRRIAQTMERRHSEAGAARPGAW